MGGRSPARATIPVLALTAALMTALGISACGTSQSRTSPWPSTPGASTPGAAGTQRQPVGHLVGRYRIPGTAVQLLITRSVHPRGGHQLRVYVEPARRELLDAAGSPLLPFVATDTTPADHLATSCRGGLLVVTTATVVGPAGTRVAWRIRETGYRIEGDHAARSATRLLAARLPTQDLAARHRDLARDAAMTGCARGSGAGPSQ